MTPRETTKKIVEKVKDCTNLYVSVWILEKSKTWKKRRFLFSKILIQNENEKILRFNRNQNQKTRALVCVSFEKRILICVCVLDSWTKRNLRFVISPFEWQALCVFLGFHWSNQLSCWKTTPPLPCSEKTFWREKKNCSQLQPFGKWLCLFLWLQNTLCF